MMMILHQPSPLAKSIYITLMKKHCGVGIEDMRGMIVTKIMPISLLFGEMIFKQPSVRHIVNYKKSLNVCVAFHGKITMCLH
jgi:hypothetical protein